MTALSPTDPNSFSRPDQCRVSNVHLDLDVNFEKQILEGYVELIVKREDKAINSVLLDTRDLKIFNVEYNGSKLDYKLHEPVNPFGSKLEISLPEDEKNQLTIRITYETSPSSSALQWLKPSQTAGKRYPYLFSQCEAIHARSLLPCQDSPSVKAPYSATVRVPKELVALMSAIRDGNTVTPDNSRTAFKFQQKVPIQSYLIAIVVGDLKSRQVGPRSTVWSEEEFVDKAAFEFSETETMLSAAEKLMGPYIWGVYDLLVLPPSFPFGGMENPCLTFVTPTLLAGDKSLTNVIAHEIAHSWTGNLVTNANFEHFWLNEGFTVFVERKIISQLQDEQSRNFAAIGGWIALQDCINMREKNDPLTMLVPTLTEIDPDDAFSSVPYEKGHTLLFYLEQLLGGPAVFEPFLRSYVEKYKFKSIKTEDWKNYLYEYFKDKKSILEEVDWNGWFYTPGMPIIKPKFDTTLADACTSLSKKWVDTDISRLSEFSSSDLNSFSSDQITEFLSQLVMAPPLPFEKLTRMNSLYGIGKMKNSEIRCRWIRLGLKAHWKDIVPDAMEFVNEQGRMKYVRPIYKDMYAWEEIRQQAIDNFLKHKDEMMYMTCSMLMKDLKLQ